MYITQDHSALLNILRIITQFVSGCHPRSQNNINVGNTWDHIRNLFSYAQLRLAYINIDKITPVDTSFCHYSGEPPVYPQLVLGLLSGAENSLSLPKCVGSISFNSICWSFIAFCNWICYILQHMRIADSKSHTLTHCW